MSIYEKHVYKTPEIPFIFHTDTRYKESHDYLGQNWHENIELLFFTSGQGQVRINAREYNVTVGDIIVINSNHLHEFKTQNSMTYHVLIIDRAFCQSNYIDIGKLHFSTHFRSEEISDCFHLLSEEFKLPHDAPWRTQTIRTLVMRILTEICKYHSEKYDKSREEDVTLISAVKRAIGFINSEYASPLSLVEICNEIGLSKYYFAREFHRISGYTIVNYINLIRCENAKLLLSVGDLSILEISERCGYSDQSYFTRIFKRYTGISPTQYRKNSQQKSNGQIMPNLDIKVIEANQIKC